jgi:hypothetical protein
MSTPVSKQVFSSMHQHDEGAMSTKGPPFSKFHTFYKRKVSMALQHCTQSLF